MGGLEKTLLFVDAFPGKATLQVKCPQVVLGCLKSLDGQLAPGLLSGGGCSKLWKTGLFQEHKTLRILKT